MPEPDRVQAIVERHFRVYEQRTESMPGAAVRLFFIMFPKAEFDARFERARAEIAAAEPGLMVFVRQESGEDVLVVMQRPPAPPRRLVLHASLFLLTLLTTTLAGALLWSGFIDPVVHPTFGAAFRAALEPAVVARGFATFSLPLLAILGVHEAAHFIAARRHGLRASLPFFLPFPPMPIPIGTLGAFISLRDPLPDRRALFDVGASGPLAGFALAIPILVAGMVLTDDAGLVAPDVDRPTVLVAGASVIDGDTRGLTRVTFRDVSNHTEVFSIESTSDRRWEFRATATVRTDNGTKAQAWDGAFAPGEGRRYTLDIPEGATHATLKIEWDDAFIGFGEPLLQKGVEALGVGGGDHISHPLYIAGWVGMLVTGINLLPAGQLDGGHVARAVLGDRMRFAAYGTLGLLLFLGLSRPGNPWIFFALFILIMGIRHPPPLNDRTPLDKGRQVVAALVLLVFLATFVAQPLVL